MEKKHDDEDITINFNWLKNLVSGKKRHTKSSEEHKHTEKKSDDDVNFDFSVVSNIVSKYGFILLLLIPLLLSVYIRTIPLQLPVADAWARQAIYNNVKNNVAAAVDQQYPNLPQQNKDALISEQVNTVLSQQSQQVEQAVKAQSDQIRSVFRDSKGNTYLGDIDSYFWLRYAQNLVNHGYQGDEIRNGRSFDNHMSAPRGLTFEVNIYPAIEAFLFKFLSIFTPITLMQAAFYTPLFLSLFAIIAAFFIGKKISGNLAGFIAAILIAVNQTALSRSLGSDNDIVNLVFPLIIVLFVFLAFDSKRTRDVIIYTILCGFFIGFYSYAWSGWWFLFFFVLICGFSYIGYLIVSSWRHGKLNVKHLSHQPEFKNAIILLIVFFVASYISLAIFGNSTALAQSIIAPFEFNNIKDANRGTSIWPNVYTTVAELNEANFSQVVGSLGGRLFWLVALLGTVLPLVKFSSEDRQRNIISLAFIGVSAIIFYLLINLGETNSLPIIFILALMAVPLFTGILLSFIFKYKLEPQNSILLTLWFIATVYASLKGVRFMLLIVPAFAVSFAAFFGIISELVSSFFSHSIEMSPKITKIAFFILAILVLIQPIRDGYAIAYSYVPSVNNAWVTTLTKIKTESAPNAIINSWWDFGHWFKYFADRAVTFDGASQNNPQAHWIGKVLLTDNETQAVAILRMLDCGSNGATEKLSLIDNNTGGALKKVYLYLGMDRESAKKDLLKNMPEQKADEILNDLYCSPPEDYFITSDDMVGKSGVWAHFGIWNFVNVQIYNYYKTLAYEEFIRSLNSQFNYTTEQSQKIYYQLNSLTSDPEINNWIAPWPSYGGGTACSQTGNETIQCNIQLSNQVLPMQINLTSKEAYVQSNQGVYYPNAFGYFDGSEYRIKRYTQNQIGYGIVLMEDNRTVLFMSEELVGSMFTRLFYLDGKGLKSFQKFYDSSEITGSRIITWKIDWNATIN